MLQLIRLFSVVFFALLSFVTSGQISQGFKFLEQGQYQQARTAFGTVLDEPVNGVAAKYGLAACCLKQSQYIGMLTEALALLRLSEQQYRQLDQQNKSGLAQYNLSLYGYERLSMQLQERAIEIANRNRSLLQLDTVIEKMPPIDTRVQKKLEDARIKLVNHAVENAKDYLTLTSLVKKHYVLVTTASYKNGLSIRGKLLDAFIKDYGYSQLKKFTVDHPNHYFSIDCWVGQFIDAVDTVSVKSLLQFMMRYPHSTLSYRADRLLSRNTLRGMVVRNEQLNREEQEQLDLLKTGWRLDDIIRDESKIPGENDQKDLFTFLKKKAPSIRAYYLMQNALQKYLNNRQWSFANALLAYSQPLFPDEQPKGCDANYSYYVEKQAWFRRVTPIVNREAEGLIRRAVEGVNTSGGDEFAPIPSADGRSLYFGATGRDESMGGEDIYVSKYDFQTKTWTQPELVRNLSSPENETPLAITFDGGQMVLFREGKLYTSKMSAKGWSQPVKMPEIINAFPWVGKATFSSDGSVLIFEAAEMAPGLDEDSNIDLYVSRKKDNGDWSAPQLLGMDVNTFSDERSPYLYPDDKTLYFSSSGHAGLGGMDIFVSKRLDDTWTNWSIPKNLGKEINSLDDDWGYTLSMNPEKWEVYTSSENLLNGLGDIYITGLPSFAKPDKIIPFIGQIQKAGTGDFSPVRIVITNPETGKPIDTVLTRPDGSFIARIPSGLSRIDYHVEGKDLFPQSKSIELNQLLTNPAYADTIFVATISDMVSKGTPATLNNITFDYDKAELKPESYPELERIFSLFNANNWQVEISGHTDNTGSREYNMGLSLRRAEAVKEYLTMKGISAGRLSIRGFGAEKPLNDNQTEAGRAQNRRVEIRISKK